MHEHSHRRWPSALNCGSRLAPQVLADRRGAGTVEFAIVFSIFAVLMIGMLELGRVVWTYNALHLTTQQAARYLTVSNSCTQSALNSWVSKSVNNGGSGLPGGATFTPVTTSGTTTDCIYNRSSYYFCQVTATYSFQVYIPFVSLKKPTLKAQACFPKIS